MTNDELKPCPVCGSQMKIGGTSLITPEKKIHYYRSICVACGWRTDEFDSYYTAVTTSNTRPIEDELRAEIERLQLDLLQAGRLEHELSAIIDAKDAEIERLQNALATARELMRDLYGTSKNSNVAMRLNTIIVKMNRDLKGGE